MEETDEYPEVCSISVSFSKQYPFKLSLDSELLGENLSGEIYSNFILEK